MPAYKDKAKGTWYASFYYEDWTGKKVKKMKRGFPTKREALEWERTFLQQQTADLEMTFENFVAVYVADMKGRIKENTWGTKEHILYKKLVPYFGKRKMILRRSFIRPFKMRLTWRAWSMSCATASNTAARSLGLSTSNRRRS